MYVLSCGWWGSGTHLDCRKPGATSVQELSNANLANNHTSVWESHRAGRNRLAITGRRQRARGATQQLNTPRGSCLNGFYFAAMRGRHHAGGTGRCRAIFNPGAGGAAAQKPMSWRIRADSISKMYFLSTLLVILGPCDIFRPHENCHRQ